MVYIIWYAKQERRSTCSHYQAHLQRQGLRDPPAATILQTGRQSQASDPRESVPSAARSDRYHPAKTPRSGPAGWAPVGYRHPGASCPTPVPVIRNPLWNDQRRHGYCCSSRFLRSRWGLSLPGRGNHSVDLRTVTESTYTRDQGLPPTVSSPAL